MLLRRRAVIGSLLCLSGAVSCAPLVRLGEIEPPPGQQTVVDMEVKPEQGRARPPAEVAAAVGDTQVAILATTPQPIVSSDTALDEMSMNVQGSSVPADDALVDEAEIATDARRLESIYMARGYFRAKSYGHRIEDRGSDRAAVTFEILERDATTVSEIRFLSACEGEPSADRERQRRLNALCAELVERIPMRVGDIWTEQAYATGLDIISRAFRAQGFIHTRVIGDNWVSRDRGVAAVWYEIDAGPLVRVMGEVIVEGNVHVATDRIRQRIDIHEGDVIDSELLRRTERDIQELGPFFSVQAAPVRQSRDEDDEPEAPPPPPDGKSPPPADDQEDEAAPLLPDRMQVKVQVAEAALWELTVGPSVVTDFVRLDLALPIGFTHRNLFGEVVALEASARPAMILPDCFGGEACFDDPEFGLETELGIRVPSFFEEYLQLSLDGTYERDPSQDTKREEIGGSVGLSRRIVTGLSARIGYNISFFNYFDSNVLVREARDEALDKSALRLEQKDLIAWFDASLILDLRDFPLDARNGGYAALSANLAGDYSGSEAAYVRLLGEVRGYWTPSFLKWLTLAARVQVGWIFFDPDQGTPQSARFKSGGATSMRGFTTDRMGDYLCAPWKGRQFFDHPHPTYPYTYVNTEGCPGTSSSRTHIGGNHLVESNFELRIHPRGGLGLVYFVDIGRVWSLSREFTLDDLFIAMGPGLRYETPVGPIRFDVGFLLGQGRRQVHFSLGQAF